MITYDVIAYNDGRLEILEQHNAEAGWILSDTTIEITP